jgi:thiamine biosynthesis lipoprotein
VRPAPPGARLAVVALSAVGLAAVASGAAEEPPQRVERRVSAMGTELTVVVEAVERAAALAASERALRAIEAVEARLSTWREDSELARLNRAPEGAAVPLSAELAGELAAAAACWRRTGGAFDPGVGALVDAWGLRAGGRLPSDEELRRAVAASGLRHLELVAPAADAAAGAGSTAVRRHPGLRLEEGGFGKGAGLAAALRAIAPYLAAASGGASATAAGAPADEARITGAMLDLGGQVALLGAPSGPGWAVAVADPRRRDRALLTVTVGGGSLATSGNSERGIEVAGRRYGHLLAPATGLPVADFGSLTVWAADPLLADGLSTGLYVWGAHRALAWAAGEPGIEVLTVEVAAGGGLRVRATAGLAARVEPLAAGLEVETVAAPGRAAGAPDHPEEGDLPSYTPDGRSGRSFHEPRAGVVVPWTGRPTARSKPATPEGATGFRGEYR